MLRGSPAVKASGGKGGGEPMHFGSIERLPMTFAQGPGAANVDTLKSEPAASARNPA